MNTLKLLCVSNGEFPKLAMDAFCARVLASSKSTMNVAYDTKQVSVKDTYVQNGTFKNWYVDPQTLSQYDSTGYHAIVYFYIPDLSLHGGADYACMTYPLNGRVYMQIRMDAFPIENNLFHENLHAMAQNLGLKGIQMDDKRFDQDLAGVGSGLYLDEDFAWLLPYGKQICDPMPKDVPLYNLYLTISSLMVKLLKQMMEKAQPRTTYTDFKNKWLGQHVDFDHNKDYQCVDVYRQYCYELDFPKSPPIVGARDIWTSYLPDCFYQIAMKPGFVPQQGDIVVWNFDPNGHIAIFDHGDENGFVSIDQNWGVPDGTGVLQYVNHTYVNVLGILRPR